MADEKNKPNEVSVRIGLFCVGGGKLNCINISVKKAAGGYQKSNKRSHFFIMVVSIQANSIYGHVYLHWVGDGMAH